MQVNNINSNQSFGRVTVTPKAQESIMRRLSTNSRETALLKDLVNGQKNNKFEVMVDSFDGSDLFGWVANGKDYYKFFNENLFARIFKSPVKFIKKLCKHADEQNAKNICKEDIRKILKDN